ncbi:MAG TPA: flagellar export chaperone FlgN [Pirellulales bacterium]|jgi:hypothetical protein|nr:flagellar export chaperone FlgN [Pirellulales bacterium]
MEFNWEHDLAALLANLSKVQQELLETLNEKRGYLAQADTAGMASLHEREQAIIEQLQACQEQRAKLLEKAAQCGLPSQSIRELVTALPQRGGLQFKQDIQDAAARSRILQHQSLTNWMLAQKTLLHLSQMIEIIATGGRLQPTYGEGEAARPRGGLVDQAA